MDGVTTTEPRLIGRVTFNLNKVIHANDNRRVFKLQGLLQGEYGAGKVYLELSTGVEVAGEVPNPCPVSFTRQRCRVNVHVYQAKNIIAQDDNGFSDPYIKCTICDQVKKTSIKQKTVFPCWCEYALTGMI